MKVVGGSDPVQRIFTAPENIIGSSVQVGFWEGTFEGGYFPPQKKGTIESYKLLMGSLGTNRLTDNMLLSYKNDTPNFFFSVNVDDVFSPLQLDSSSLLK